MRNNKKTWVLALTAITILLLVTVLWSLATGTGGIGISKLFSVALHGKGSTDYGIIFKIRLPRILMGFAVGGALSLSGTILQGMFRNPLVEPYTLGISGGATLGVAFNIIFGFSSLIGLFSMPVFGFLGAFIVIIIIYSLSIKKGIIKMNGLLLTGVMISFISSSLLMLVFSMSNAEEVHNILFWIMGSLEEANHYLIILAMIVSFAGLIISYLFCHDLNALALGEEQAIHLGVKVETTKRVFFFIAAMLTGVSVSLAGQIGFVGLIVPHLLRMFVGGDHRILLVSSYLGGAAFLIFCDTVARTVASPVELPVGVVTGILGGSFFVYVMSRRGLLWEK